jgi:Xaa-Pro aminopeptidase
MKKTILWTTLFVLLLWGILPLNARRSGFPAEEYIQRRTDLMKKVPRGMIMLFAEAQALPAQRFRQDNDFFYFSGCEDMNAVLIMFPQTGRTALFLPRKSPREEMYEGQNLLGDLEGRKGTGIDDFYPLDMLNEFIARNIGRCDHLVHVRLSGQDTVDGARHESLLFQGRRSRNPFNDQLSMDAHRARILREKYPALTCLDLAPHIDELRMIKTPREIEILRRNGRISAEAVKAAMKASAAGVYEYELEAAAMHTILKNGANGAAYAPIVGSGPNSCILHYDRSERAMKDGELVLMDFGADLDHLCMDISRTWPVSGIFTPEQRDAYRVVLEVQKASMEAYRPGVTLGDVKKHVAAVLAKKNIDPRGLEGVIHHYVGMATHDVGIEGIPLREGMVLTAEPGLYYPEKGFGIRIEDTVLITRDGCEILSADVPKEIEEIEALLATRR